MIDNIHIIGGGTSGWLTAIFLSKYFSNSNITLIESKSIGIVGVGEGTTPNIRALFKKLDIDENDFQKNTNSTKKIGINFENWSGDNSSYNHDFYLKDTPVYAFHFDTYTLGEYFKKEGTNRGISYIQDDVLEFKTNKIEGEEIITEIVLNDNGVIKTNFVFDCTGFSKLVLDKVMNSEWIPVKQYLSLNSALPFYLPNDIQLNSNSNTRTKSISMKNGWLWQIPLQDRMGCGYVFDSKYINDEEAKKEVEEYLGCSIEFKNKISFESGYFHDVWKGNCISIGLSGGFFEPIEATSIMTIIIQLESLINTNLDSENRKFYNDIIRNVNEQVLNFIRYHYVCDRDDTEFWRDYKNKPIPAKLKLLLNSKNRFKISNRDNLIKILETPIGNTVFDIPSYLIQSSGNFKKDKILI